MYRRDITRQRVNLPVKFAWDPAVLASLTEHEIPAACFVSASVQGI